MLRYQDFSQQLHAAGICQPTLVIDKTSLDNNLSQLKAVLARGYAHRIVVKSLPCMPLIDYVSTQTQSQNFMCFHGPFIRQIATAYPKGDILLGKPLPALAFEALLEWFQKQAKGKDAPKLEQVQWLVDSLARLEQYLAIARRHSVCLRINLEVDIGLHRGGFSLDEEYEQAISLIKESTHLQFSGLMGYEAHASKIPSFLGGLSGALSDSCQQYAQFKARVAHISDANTCFNSGGSTTFTQYTGDEPCNELSVGSALLKPSDFDLDHLDDYQASAFIATPLLKRVENIALPGPALLSTLLRRAKQLPQTSGYIYGGNWLAEPCHPDGTHHVSLFGHSSNQELYGFAPDCTIKPDELVLFRPKQSEAVLLQFGDIAVFENGQISAWWPILTQGDNPAQGVLK